MTGIFELKKHKVKGQFCLLAFRYYCEAKKLDLTQLGDVLAKGNIFEISDLIYYACKAYADLKDTDFNYNKAQFTNIFSEIKQDELSGIVAKLQEVELFGEKLGEAQAKSPENKKK